MEYRTENDSMGEMKVPADRLWGAQTARSLRNFAVGEDRMPAAVIHSIALIKRAAADANNSFGKLGADRAQLIGRVCLDIESGALDGEFPLSVWQTGSGTQTNMNVNEVIVNRAKQLDPAVTLHPNDHVNMSQSSNDVFPSAMSIAAAETTEKLLLPELARLCGTLRALELKSEGVMTVGRTHMMDAVPMSFSQEVSGWRAALESDAGMIKAAAAKLCALPIGGSAVGTGLNAPEGFGDAVCERINRSAVCTYTAADNKFAAMSSKSSFIYFHGALKSLAADLMKLAKDVRLLASGPRCGLAEIIIPANEPGSSIMPGKVNPTQCESMIMVCTEVFGNDTAVTLAAADGILQLNVCMPLIIFNTLRSLRLLSDSVRSFNDNCAAGILPVREKMKQNLDRSLMRITALTPLIGYDNAAKAAKKALDEDSTLSEAVFALGLLTEEQLKNAGF